MKSISLPVILGLFISCINPNKPVNHKNLSHHIDDHIIHEISQYYIQGDGRPYSYQITKSDSSLALIFKDESFRVMYIQLPTIYSDSSLQIISADFNNDKTEDLIISVSLEGGWAGGNVFDLDYFVFIKQDGSYILSSVNNAKSLTDCESGIFELEDIINGQLTGISYCYAPNDGNCCPSLKYKTILEIEDGKLKHALSTPISP